MYVTEVVQTLRSGIIVPCYCVWCVELLSILLKHWYMPHLQMTKSTHWRKQSGVAQ